MRAILFDWDGTIVDSVEHLYDAYAVVCRRFGLPFDRHVFRQTFAPDWRLMYRRMGMPGDRIEEAGRAWVDTFASHAVEPFPGIADRLERLAYACVALGLVTGGHREIVSPQLDRHRLGRFFRVRVFGNDLAVGKPDPGPLLLALGRLGDAAATGRIRQGYGERPDAAGTRTWATRWTTCGWQPRPASAGSASCRPWRATKLFVRPAPRRQWRRSSIGSIACWPRLAGGCRFAEQVQSRTGERRVRR